jgi:hypothetical protein
MRPGSKAERPAAAGYDRWEHVAPAAARKQLSVELALPLARRREAQIGRQRLANAHRVAILSDAQGERAGHAAGERRGRDALHNRSAVSPPAIDDERGGERKRGKEW